MTSIDLPNTLGEALDGQQSGDAASPPPTVSAIAPASEKQEKYNDNKNGRKSYVTSLGNYLLPEPVCMADIQASAENFPHDGPPAPTVG
jgi:hypothetical protein